MTAPRILLVSCSAGMGHVRAAQALEAALEQRSDVTCRHVDILAFAQPLFRWLYARGYEIMVDRFPDLWRLLYETTNKPVPVNPLQDWCTRRSLRRFFALLDSEQFDAIVATHFLVPDILRARRDVPVYQVVTDIDLHQVWAHSDLRHSFVAAEEIRELLMQKTETPRARISVTGIPIQPAFAQPVDKAAMYEHLQFDPARMTFLALSSGFAHANLVEAIQYLGSQYPHAQCIAIAGNSAELLRQLQGLSLPNSFRFRSFGFVDNVHDYMAISDVLLTKAGGLSTSEGLASGLAILFLNAIPGQEEANAAYVERQGAGRRCYTLPQMQLAIDEFMAWPAILRNMKVRSRDIGKPDAAARIADIIAADLTAQS